MDHHHDVVATAILPTLDMDDAVAFYQGLGFHVDRFSDGYALVTLDGHEHSHLEVQSDLVVTENRSAIYLNVPDVDEWHRRWSSEGLPVTDIHDEPWGMREFRLVDPWRNTIRVGTNL